jgi:cobalt/nickel transport system permease protein
MPAPDPRQGRALLSAWLAAAFALSAVTDWRVLAAAAAVALLLLARGAGRHLARVARIVLPLSLGASAAGWAFDRLAGRPGPGWDALLALNLRAALLAFLSLAVLARVDVLRAAAPWPWATRLLVVSLAQIHALRLLAVDSRLGLRSRLVRRPRTREVVRGAGAITGTLVVLSSRNARDVADALRARGFR